MKLMKHTSITVLLVVAMVFAVGCSKDDDSNPVNSGGGGTSNSTIVGSWVYKSSSFDDNLYVDMTVAFGSDGKFRIINPDWSDGNGGNFNAIEEGTYSLNGSQLSMTATSQTPEGFQYFTIKGGASTAQIAVTGNQLNVKMGSDHMTWTKQ